MHSLYLDFCVLVLLAGNGTGAMFEKKKHGTDFNICETKLSLIMTYMYMYLKYKICPGMGRKLSGFFVKWI